MTRDYSNRKLVDTLSSADISAEEHAAYIRFHDTVEPDDINDLLVALKNSSARI